MLAPLEITTDTAPLFDTLTGLVIVTVRVSIVGAPDRMVPLTVMSLAAMNDGTVVPDGNVTVIVLEPAVSAPPAPTLNAMVYAPVALCVLGLGVTVGVEIWLFVTS